MQDTDIEIAELAKALAHPARLRILRLLLAMRPSLRPLSGFFR
ncbi:MAG: hypothetical protein ACNA7F_14825 [Roseovarius sp.]